MHRPGVARRCVNHSACRTCNAWDHNEYQSWDETLQDFLHLVD
jgi:hypothetical protein